MLQEFKAFVLRGNLVELAVAFVMGAAFTALVTGFVTAFVTPLIALVAGQPDFSGVGFDVRGTHFPAGAFVAAAVTLVITAAVLFFLIVKPVNTLQTRIFDDEHADPTPDARACPECLSSIPVAARRCAFCTSEVGPSGEALPAR